MYWRPVKRVRQVQRPDGSTKAVTDWVARYPDAAGKRKSAGTFRRERDAANAIQAAMDAVAEAAAQGPEAVSRSATVSEYIPRWKADHPRSKRTTVVYDSRLRQALDIPADGKPLGEWNLRDLRRRQADQVLGALLEQERAARGAKAILKTLSALTEDAIYDEFCEINPWLGIRVRPGDPRVLKRSAPRRVWTFEELREWASFGGPYEPALRVGIDCGMRLGELLALEREHWQPGFILVRQAAWEGQLVAAPVDDDDEPIKNHDRDAPLPPSTERLLMKMPVRIGCNWLFPSPTGRLWRAEKFYRDVVNVTTERANADRRDKRLDPTFREIRRSYVTNLRRVGIDVADLADVTGHSVETAHRAYTEPTHTSYDQIRRAIG